MLQRKPTPHPRRSAFTLLEMLVVVSIIVVLAGVGAFYLLPRGEEAKARLAKSNAQSLARQCEYYHSNNDNNYPQNLQQLVQPPKGEAAYVKPQALNDPWGRPYQYDPSGPNNGGSEPDIWAEHPKFGQLGNW